MAQITKKHKPYRKSNRYLKCFMHEAKDEGFSPLILFFEKREKMTKRIEQLIEKLEKVEEEIYRFNENIVEVFDRKIDEEHGEMFGFKASFILFSVDRKRYDEDFEDFLKPIKVNLSEKKAYYKKALIEEIDNELVGMADDMEELEDLRRHLDES